MDPIALVSAMLLLEVMEVVVEMVKVSVSPAECYGNPGQCGQAGRPQSSR